MRQWEKYKECFADGLLSFAGVITFIVFLLIVLYGEVRIIEDNKWLLWFELTVIAPGVVALGIERLIKDLRANDKDE